MLEKDGNMCNKSLKKDIYLKTYMGKTIHSQRSSLNFELIAKKHTQNKIYFLICCILLLSNLHLNLSIPWKQQ